MSSFNFFQDNQFFWVINLDDISEASKAREHLSWDKK
jgi:hypothetical protein